MSDEMSELGAALSNVYGESVRYGRAAEAIAATLRALTLATELCGHIVDINDELKPELRSVLDGLQQAADGLESAGHVIDTKLSLAEDRLRSATTTEEGTTDAEA